RRLDRPLADPELARDPRVGTTLGHQGEDLPLSDTELIEDGVGPLPAHELGDDGRVDDTLAFEDALEGVDQHGDVRDTLLEEVAETSRLIREQSLGVAGLEILAEQHNAG